MPFLGQEPLVGGYHVLDNITASATNTYNLLLGGVAFTPESANHLLVSLNGVIQKPGSSFSISGSQITFIPSSGTLSNSDSIDFIIALGDVLNIGVPSDNVISTAKIIDNAVTTAKIVNDAINESKLQVSNSPTNGYFLSAQSGNTGGLTWAEAGSDFILDNWRINSNFSTNGDVNQYWERFTRTGTAQIGTQMQEASGIFTFPKTGLYQVRYHANINVPNGASSEHIYILATINNSAYTSMAKAETAGISGSASDHSIFCETLVNVTDVANVKVKFSIDGFETGGYLYGSPNSNASTGFARTQVFFERKGAAQ